MIQIKIITHYLVDDPEFEGDYTQIEIFMNMGLGHKLVKTYGDYYHDKGDEKAAGFMDGISALTDDYSIEEIEVADYEG